MLIGRNLKKLIDDNNNLGHFVSMYDKTPTKFIEGKAEYEENIEGKYVVCVENAFLNNEVGQNGIEILGAYYPMSAHKATLKYVGHIAFISIKRKADDRLLQIVYKDDECFPQTFAEWFDEAYSNHGWKDIEFTKEKCLELIRIVIKGYSQDLSLDIKEEDIIILEGL